MAANSRRVPSDMARVYPVQERTGTDGVRLADSKESVYGTSLPESGFGADVS
jgi:hypothetical protein